MLIGVRDGFRGCSRFFQLGGHFQIFCIPKFSHEFRQYRLDEADRSAATGGLQLKKHKFRIFDLGISLQEHFVVAPMSSALDLAIYSVYKFWDPSILRRNAL